MRAEADQRSAEDRDQERREILELEGLPLPQLQQQLNRAWERALVKHLAYRNRDRLDELRGRLGADCSWSTLWSDYAELGRLLIVLARRGETWSPRAVKPAGRLCPATIGWAPRYAGKEATLNTGAGHTLLNLRELAVLLDEGTLREQVLRAHQRLGEEIEALAALPAENINAVIDDNLDAVIDDTLDTVRELTAAMSSGLEVLLAHRRMAYDDGQEADEEPD
jgi:hypothetical protein